MDLERIIKEHIKLVDKLKVGANALVAQNKALKEENEELKERWSKLNLEYIDLSIERNDLKAKQLSVGELANIVYKQIVGANQGATQRAYGKSISVKIAQAIIESKEGK